MLWRASQKNEIPKGGAGVIGWSRVLSSVTTCRNIFPTPCSSCLQPFTLYLPHTRKQLSLQFQITLYTCVHYCNPVSKNTIQEQCSKANERFLVITLGPKQPCSVCSAFQGLRHNTKGNWSSDEAWWHRGKHLLCSRLGVVTRICVQE